jgi:hypothetical protein
LVMMLAMILVPFTRILFAYRLDRYDGAASCQ